MKKYIYNLALISFLFFTIVLLLIFARVVVAKSVSWKLPLKEHILFLGASHVQDGINDEMIEGAKNWSRESERYMFTYIKLKHVLSHNEQIDTIFLQLAPTDLWENTDYKYHTQNEQAGYLPLYWPHFDLENWSVFLSEPFQAMGIICRNLLDFPESDAKSYRDKLGGYFKNKDVMDINKVYPQLIQADNYGHNENYKYLRYIIELCNSRGIKLYFLYCPTFHVDYYYDETYFYNAYKNYFSDVELLDYSRMPVNADERADAGHLNYKGAIRFTNVLKSRFGF